MQGLFGFYSSNILLQYFYSRWNLAKRIVGAVFGSSSAIILTTTITHPIAASASIAPIEGESLTVEERLKEMARDRSTTTSIITTTEAVQSTTPSPATAANITILIVFFLVIIGIVVCIIYRLRARKKNKLSGKNAGSPSSPGSAQSENRSSLWSNTEDLTKEGLNVV